MDRLDDLVERRLLPALTSRGFDRDDAGTVFADRHDVVWELDLSLAPWCDEGHLSFAVRWEVHVPGLSALTDDPAPAVSGAGEWFDLRPRPAVVAAVADGRLATRVLRAFDATVLPELRALDGVELVQARLHEGLVTGRGVPHDDELRTIRRIAALSALLGDRANAARWIDYLEIRSSAAIAPDVVAERLAPLRRRLAS